MTVASTFILQPLDVIRGAWLVLGLYWLVESVNKKVARKRQPAAERLIHVIYMGVAFLLLYGNDPLYGLLNQPFLPDRLWIAQVGAAIAVLGVAFAIWARRHIGMNWSAEVTIKKDHQLIRTGPYAHIRHPIYTGILLATLGTAIAIGEYRALVAFVMVAIGFIFKARKEENFLAQEFGPAFDDHKRLTGFFLPRFS
jgi:protein-S-isoprenylcysteine O-methyltransferase Ste14